MSTEKITADSEMPLVRVDDLSKKYRLRNQAYGWWKKPEVEFFPALRNVSIKIKRGETLGVVGESGCGKTTLGRVLLRLTDLVDGKVYFDGIDVYSLSPRELRYLRHRMQMIFQNPYASLNTHMRVKDIVAEGVRIKSNGSKDEVEERVRELLDQVNFHKDKITQYPSGLSGGERRRVGIARILAVQPEFIVADEPVAALDLSIKSQVINLMQELKVDFGLTFMFISHDIGMIKHLSDRIAVMYLGKVVEQGANRAIDRHRCLHPYTQQLLNASFYMYNTGQDDNGVNRTVKEHEWDVPEDIPAGCPYHPRCPLYHQKGKPKECREVDPPLTSIGEHYGEEHEVACYYADEVNPVELGGG
jgi:ABC-type oligopeptide transport system ATPase subunit